MPERNMTHLYLHLANGSCSILHELPLYAVCCTNAQISSAAETAAT